MSNSNESTVQSDRHEVVILGGHFAGVSAAHYLLRHVFPTLIGSFPKSNPRITLITPQTHFFWNIAAPRHLCARDLIEASKVLLPLQEAFEAYPPEQFSLMQGSAKSVDPSTHSVKVTLVNGETRNVQYSSLVLATGRKSKSPLWQMNDSGEKTKSEFANIQDRLQTANSVVIAGGGPIGVETAGELASRYPNVNVRLYSGNDRVLSQLLPGTSATAEKRLKDLGVRVFHNQRYTAVKEAVRDRQQSVVSFGQGHEDVADVFIDATGGRPNSGFLPKDWINSSGAVRTDDKTTQVEGIGSGGVFAVGDVASYSDGTLNGVFRAIPAMGAALRTDAARRLGGHVTFPARQYTPLIGTQLVPTGPNGGVGQLSGWRIPSFLVWVIKSRTFFVENAPGVVCGNGFRKP